jgi:glycosyltransferase involved in cell wall biosynthesis
MSAADPRRVAMLIDTLRGGGAERIAVELAAALHPDRYEATVLATREGGLLEDVLQRHGVEYTILGRRHGFALKKFRCAQRLLAEVDVIHSHMLGSNLWGALFARLTKTPLVAREPTFSGVRSTLRTYGYRWWIAPVARRIICPTTTVARSLKAEGVPPALVEVIPNGVRSDAAVPRAEARAELGLEPNDFVVGIVAGLRVEKAHEVLFGAAALLREEGRSMTLCLVGDGVRRRELERAAIDLKLNGSVVWAGERPDAKRLSKAFDVGVLCSDFEGLPNAALEILAAGVPMISTAVGTMPEILRGGAGVTVPIRDEAALAAAIRRFLDDPELVQHASHRALEVVRRDYDFERMVRAFERVYDQALGRRVDG